MRRLLGLLVLGAFVLCGWSSLGAARDPEAWSGIWTYDLCHEDRKGDHDKDTFCRQGKDRIEIEVDSTGAIDITLCPANPWGERGVEVDPQGRLKFRTREGLDVRLTLGPDRTHYKGRFRSSDGHSGRVWGRRVVGCR